MTHPSQDDPRLFARMPLQGPDAASSSSTAWRRRPATASDASGRPVRLRLRRQLAARRVPDQFANPVDRKTECADVDPAGAGADERPVHRRRHQPGPQRDAGGGHRRAVHERRRQKLETLYLAALCAGRCAAGGGAAGRATSSSGGAEPATRRRRWPTCSGCCSTAASSCSTIDTSAPASRCAVAARQSTRLTGG